MTAHRAPTSGASGTALTAEIARAEAAEADLQSQVSAFGAAITPTAKGVVRGNAAGSDFEQVVLVNRGTNAAMPAAGTEGRVYQTSDNPRGTWYDTGTAWVPIGPVSAVRTSDSAAVTANTGVAADDTLQLPIAANQTMRVELDLIVSGANATHDFKYDLSVPAGATAYYGGASGSSVTGWAPLSAGSTPSALLTSGTQTVGTIGGIIGIPLKGVIVNGSTAGLVKLRWAQATSDAGALLLKAGSYMIGMGL